MNNCKLCKKKEGNKKGSHIVPHFLLKKIENIKGKTGRDYELAFSIDEFETTSYFGRSILPEKLEEVYGELSDEEIENNSHPLIVDYIFCSDCEERLSVIESTYSKTLKKQQEKEYDSGIASEVGLLFWLSVIWRMSINKKSGAELTSFENETSRRILHKNLKKKISDIDIEGIQTSPDLNKITYRLFRCPNFTDKNPTHLLFHPKFRKPYVLMVDEFILLLSFKNNYNDFINLNFFGLKKDVFQATVNQKISNEKIYPITEEDFISIHEELYEFMRNIRGDKLENYFNKVHRVAGGKGRKMSEEIKKEILKELKSEEKKLGRKYTIADLNNSTIKILKQYAS